MIGCNRGGALMASGSFAILPGRFGRSALPALLAISLLALAGCDDQAEGAAQAPPPPPPVTVAEPLIQRITEWYEFTGRFEATESVEVRARVSGYLQSVNFSDGELVEKGQLLFVIDPRPYEAAAEEARAQIESAKARVELADAELTRAGQLVDRSAVSRSTYDQRVQEKRAAEAAVGMAEAALRRAERDLEGSEERRVGNKVAR